MVDLRASLRQGDCSNAELTTGPAGHGSEGL